MIDENRPVAPRGRSKRTTYVGEAAWAKFSEFKAAIIGRKGETAVARVLLGCGVAALHDVLLPDHLGVTQMDHLVRTPSAIMVIETKTYAAHITGSLGGQWLVV